MHFKLEKIQKHIASHCMKKQQHNFVAKIHYEQNTKKPCAKRSLPGRDMAIDRCYESCFEVSYITLA